MEELEKQKKRIALSMKNTTSRWRIGKPYLEIYWRRSLFSILCMHNKCSYISAITQLYYCHLELNASHACNYLKHINIYWPSTSINGGENACITLMWWEQNWSSKAATLGKAVFWFKDFGFSSHKSQSQTRAFLAWVKPQSCKTAAMQMQRKGGGGWENL